MDVKEAFTGHCHLEDKIPSSNAHLVHNGEDIPDLSIVRRKASRSSPVIVSNPCLTGAYVLSLETDRLGSQNVVSSSVTSKMPHMAFDHVARTMARIWRSLTSPSWFPC